MKDKMFPEIATKLKPGAVKTDSVQPVFITNAGINTSNIETTALLNLLPKILKVIPVVGGAAAMAVDTVLQSEIDAAKTLPKFARGGSFTTMNSNVSQFIAGDSINNRINPERVTVDWSKQRVNVQPLRNNIANVETGKITDPILNSSPTVTITEGNNKGKQAISVMNSVNPFDENLKVDGVSAKPMEVLLALAESLISINNTLSSANQLSASHATMTAKAVDAINSLANMSGGSSGVTTDIFASLKTLARGD